MTISRRRQPRGSGDAEKPQVFLSHAGDDGFEANLLQYAIEQMLAEINPIVWTYERDQGRDERNIGKSLKDRVRESKATVFLVSPSTLNAGATQWMELAYADAYDVPTFIILHHLTFDQLKARERGVPPLLLESQCNSAAEWRRIIEDIRILLTGRGQ
jgi:hypothetical protein